MSARYRSLLSALVMLSTAACAGDGDAIQQGDDNVVAVTMPEEDAGVVEAPLNPATPEPTEPPNTSEMADASVPAPDAAVMVADATVSSAPDASASTPDATLPPVPSELPCDVEAILATNCQRCHAEGAKNGTSLITRAHLIAMSKKDPALQVADRVLLRMAETEKPMPPVGKGEPVSEEDRAVLESWVEQGMPAGSCVK